MYRVLIVDDERLIREGLRGLIDWGALGFEVAGVAADGVEALAFLAETPADLVIADIRMPRMDGLDLLADLRSRGNPARFLVLSGFAEFEYAQRASSQGIDGYLLKPVDESELARHLAEVRRRLDSTQFSALTLVQGADRVPPAYDWGRWQVLLVAVFGASGQPRTLDPATDRRLREVCRDRQWGEVFPEPGALGILLQQVYPGGHNLSRLAKEIAGVLASD
ncbi:MAG TPA: response regulator, partial [Spirochaetia bacterium]|nr:response regulator [Spirochaetia bacterium]